MTVVVVRCKGCGHTTVVVLNKYTGIPTLPGIAGVVEELGTCPKCGRRFENPKVVNLRWSAWSPGTGS
jgi:DNA replicative helicase MCM subunit Mcm2 (Cdc46/Mcm family)